MTEYNQNALEKMNLVFFFDAIEHISRTCRILSQPRGNCHLVGVAGSGKQSLTKLSAFICDMPLKVTELGKAFKMSDFDAQLIQLFKDCGTGGGIEGLPTVFLVTDTHIIYEQQVEYINNVLNTGEIPNLFENDKTGAKDVCKKEVAEYARELGITGDM